jgi:hypothetical protein
MDAEERHMNVDQILLAVAVMITAGIQNSSKTLDSRLHGNDGERSSTEKAVF